MEMTTCKEPKKKRMTTCKERREEEKNTQMTPSKQGEKEEHSKDIKQRVEGVMFS
jgi:hypothetical protein